MSQYPERSAEEKETFQAKNTKILYQLLSSLTRMSGLSILGMSVLGMKQKQMLSPLHQILIYKIVILPQFRQFWDTIQSKLADKNPYTASIGDMKMRLPELQDDNKEAEKPRSKRLPEG